MARRRIFTGSRFEDMAGYCRAIVEGDWIFVSGTAGFDFKTNTISDDPAVQTQQCLKTISETLAKADSSLADIVRMRVYVSDRAHVGPVAAVLAKTFAKAEERPTNTTIVCGFAEPTMKVELEATALRQRS